MSTPWIDITPVADPVAIVEIRKDAQEPVEIYGERYRQDTPGPGCVETVKRTNIEIFDDFDVNSSVLLFGSGHSFWANQTELHPNIDEVSVLDLVLESSYNLVPWIKFFHSNVLVDDIPVISDYIYSAHTVEHFSREDVLNRVLPHCLSKARKAVVFVVPFEEHWSEDVHHRCLFYVGDELYNRALRYKVIREGQELVLWFEGCAK